MSNSDLDGFVEVSLAFAAGDLSSDRLSEGNLLPGVADGGRQDGVGEETAHERVLLDEPGLRLTDVSKLPPVRARNPGCKV